MRRFVFLASLAAMIIMAVPAMASAVTLTAGGETLGAGAKITATSSNLVFTGESGLQLLCETKHVEGEYEGGGTIKVTSGTFTGPNGRCATNNPGVFVDITATNLPWVIHLNAEDKAVITGAQFTATFTTALGVSFRHCTFTANEGVVNGTYNTTEPLSISVGSALFNGSSAECGTGTLTGSFDSITNESNTVEAHE